jgi:carboxyl-terminal processing protease
VLRILFILTLFFFYPQSSVLAQAPTAILETKTTEQPKPMPVHDEYLAYFEEVYKVMDSNYYFDIQRSDFDRFLKVFEEKIYKNLLLEGKSSDYVRWRSAAYLVDFLKQPDDIFSRFLPPKPAEKFAQEVYGEKIDFGIEGHLVEPGFQVDFVEPRSDAYELGLRENDLILRLDEQEVVKLGEARVKELLVPLKGVKVKINYLDALERQPRMITPESKEYYKQTVFLKPTGVQDVYCLDIQKFNRQTNEDMGRYLGYLASKRPQGLVIDLRKNPGGPPLAALAISAFFLPNDELFAYFEGRHKPRAELTIPRLPEAYHFDWPMIILVSKDTGSASELFSGIMQERKRAMVMGQDTAGQVLLKSLFDMSDGSTVALVTARGHFPDGRPFPFDGVKPNEYIPSDQVDDMITLAAKYLFLKSVGKIK